MLIVFSATAKVSSVSSVDKIHVLAAGGIGESPPGCWTAPAGIARHSEANAAIQPHKVRGFMAAFRFLKVK